MNTNQLQNLIQAALDKDQKAQTQLINLFWVDIFSFVMKKVEDKNEADEITVVVFSKVLSKLDLYDPNQSFRNWILAIAQNTIIDAWRKKSRDQEDSDDLEDFVGQFAMSPEELLISVEEQKQLNAIVESMDENYKEIIRLRFFDELSIKEISEKLQLSESNTKVRIMRAKKVLAQLLRDHQFTIE